MEADLGFRAAPGLVYLKSLEPGTRFAVGGPTGKQGTLARVGTCSCKVQFDGLTIVEIAGKTFSRPLALTDIAPNTEVVALDSLPEGL